MKPARCASCSVTPCARVEQQHDDVRVLDRLQRLDHRELLDRLEHLAAAAHARGVDQRVAPSVALEVEIDRVARRPRLVECDHALLAEERVDERRLADIGSPDDRNLDRPGVPPARSTRASWAARVKAQVRLAAVTLSPCAEEIGCGSPSPSSKNSAAARSGARPSALLAASTTGRPERRSTSAIDLSPAVSPLPRVDQEDDDVRLGDRLQRLLRHFVQDPVLRDGLEAAGVDDDERCIADATAAVVPVARQPREIGDQRRAGAGKSIEQRRLADVRATDEDKGGQHRRQSVGNSRAR